MGKYEKKIENIGVELMEYYFDHPYLTLDTEIEEMIFGDKYGEELKAIHETFAEKSGSKPTDPDVIAAQQDELDTLTQQYYDTRKEVPYYKWGYIPREKSYVKLITHMFIHGGWLHLIFNLLLFYILGPFIEDAWGKPIYIGFYLLMGVLAALLFSMHYPNSQVPMVGASGAISGVMGAFLIRFWKTKIKFAYLFSVIVRGTFHAPAWLMLPLWLLNELFNAQYMASIAEQGGGGVAHWAHIWGFILGVVFALVVKIARVEEKFVAPKIEAQTSYVNKNFAIYEQAVMLIDTGKKDEAYAMLQDAVREDPTFQDNVEALWNLSLEIGKENEASRPLIKLIEKEVRHNQLDLALYHFGQLRTKIPGAHVSPHSKVMFIEALADKEEYKEAGQLTDELFNEINLGSPPGLLLNFCNAVLKLDLSSPGGDLSLTERAIKLALRHPDIPENKKEELKAKLQGAPKMKEDADNVEQGAAYTYDQDAIPIDRSREYTPKQETIKIDPVGFAAGAGAAAFHHEPEIEPVQAKKEEEPFLILPKNIKVTRAVPAAVKGKKMTLHVQGAGQKIVSLDKIQVISVAKISSPAEGPYLLLDLFLDDPTGDSLDVRTIRFLSKTFNPQKFVPGAKNPLEAFNVFTSALLKLSGAKPYPDLESVQLKKIKVFPTVKEYEDSIG